MPRPLPGNEVDIPAKSKSCSRKAPPGVTLVSVKDGFDSGDMDVEVQTRWCRSPRDLLRIRLIKWERDVNGKVRTSVLSEQVEQYRDYPTLFQQKCLCKDEYFFAEACVSSSSENTGGDQLLCSASSLKFLLKAIFPEPPLQWRPPMFLKLAPGDSAAMTTVISPTRSSGNINSVYLEKRIKQVLRGIQESPEGRIRSAPWTLARSVEAKVPLREGGISETDNGTLLYLNYTTALFRTSQDTWRHIYNTTVLVSRDFGSLIKQDTSVPVFSTPVYPRTMFMEPVEITVEAKNPRGGMREGGVPTELHYQWYWLQTTVIGGRNEPLPIPGATGKTLRINKAECNLYENCGNVYCSDLRVYYVDVCNTFGCRRSEQILPNILPPAVIPDGKEWNSDFCSFVDVNG